MLVSPGGICAAMVSERSAGGKGKVGGVRNTGSDVGQEGDVGLRIARQCGFRASRPRQERIATCRRRQRGNLGRAGPGDAYLLKLALHFWPLLSYCLTTQ